MAQSFELLTPLSNMVSESSGLIYLNGKIIVNKDSGNAAALYEIDSLTGNILRTVVVDGATNVGWEDLTYDDTYIYIADIGNNMGSRTDLKVLRILRSDYFETDNDVVTPEIISFHYADQTDFTPAQYATDFDAETLVSYQDSLYIFTKNWLSIGSYIYPLSKTPGNYAVAKKDSIGGSGLVTGGDLSEDTGELILTTYSIFSAQAVYITDFPDSWFSQGDFQHINLPVPDGYSYQIEGIGRISPGNYFLIAEGSFSGAAGLYKLTFSPLQVADYKKDNIRIYPNPARAYFSISGVNEVKVNIYTQDGKLMKTENSHTISLSDLSKGIYFVDIRESSGTLLSIQKLVVE